MESCTARGLRSTFYLELYQKAETAEYICELVASSLMAFALFVVVVTTFALLAKLLFEAKVFPLIHHDKSYRLSKFRFIDFLRKIQTRKKRKKK
ncbi:hypothetical protein C5167_003166 [Papaver somniferum]|uniref:Uncharacterized protein n=1 Tax=Papaver somniferum TaxID=3469 RepID=A0A4Y7KY11_PAPSO|nr:hypothetical protein C5167_003166 [Papaver somniferum]